MILIVVTLSATSVSLIYWTDITNHYKSVEKHNARAVENVFLPEVLKNCGDVEYRRSKGQATDENVAAVVNDPVYVELKRFTESLDVSNESNYIYIVVYDVEVSNNYSGVTDVVYEWKPFTYIMDTYYIRDMQYALGESGSIDIDVRDAVKTSWLEGKNTEIMITYWHTGEIYILTGMHVVIYESKTVAIICVEIPLPSLESNLNNFVFTIIIVDTVVLLLIMILAFSPVI